MSVKIFFCYARGDEPLRKELEKHLRVLRRQGPIDVWYDRQISAGTEWEREIDTHLNTAQIILLLISPDFMDSDYCYSKEMKRAMERHGRGEARVIPVILRPVYWQEAPFSKLQVLPLNGKPITQWASRHGRDKAFVEVTVGIREAIEKQWPSTSRTAHKFQNVRDTSDPQHSAQLDASMAIVLIHKANTLFELKNYAQAYLNFSLALSLDYNYASTYFPSCDLGETLYHLKYYSDALVAYIKALRLDPDDIVAHIGMGNTLLKLKHYGEALLAYENALRLDPSILMPTQARIMYSTRSIP